MFIYACYTSPQSTIPFFACSSCSAPALFLHFIRPPLFFIFGAPAEEETRSRLFFMLKSRAHTHARCFSYIYIPPLGGSCCSPCEKAERGGKARELRNGQEERKRDSSSAQAELLLKIMFSPRIIFARMKNVLSDGDNS